MNGRLYSTTPPGRSWWKKMALFGAALALVCGTASAQLANTYIFNGVTTGNTLADMTAATTIGSAANDDTGYPSFAIGFNFPYEGVNYTQASVTPDGFLVLNTASFTAANQFTNAMVSTTNRPKLMAWWDDLALGGAGLGGYVKRLNTTVGPNNVLVVEWFVTMPRNLSGAANTKFQIWLYDDGTIEYYYGVVGTVTTSATVGINSVAANASNFISITPSNGNGTASTVTANNSCNTWPGDGTRYRFTLPAPCTGTPTAGTIPASTTGCGNTPVTLSSTGSTAAVGITYQWEESDDDGVVDTWAPAVGGSGATTTSYTTPGFVGVRYYRLTVTCTPSTLSATTNSCQVNQNAPCQFTIARNTGISYSTVVGNGGVNYSGFNGSTSTDDATSNAVSLAGTTFTYKGTTVTGFKACTNGWLTFNTAQTTTTFSNVLGASGTLNAALAPFWDDLVCTGNPATVAGQNASMYYKIDGTLGSGTAKIIAEWVGMEKFSNPGPNLNFQVILDENGNTITFRYGTFEGFSGSQNTQWSYSLGLNAWSFGTPGSYTDVLALRDENTTNFDFTPATVSSGGLNAQVRAPECFSQYVFTPATAYPGPGPAPSAPPANDEIAGAITLTVNPSLCTGFCGTYYHSMFATGTVGIPVCSAGTPGTPDDDVWFKFNANAANTTIRVIGGPDYDPVVQLLDATGTTALFCVNASATGLIETMNATGLVPGTDYLVRVYSVATGTPTTSRNDFSICVSATPVPPANDECAGATVLTPGIGCTPIAGNSLIASTSPQASCTGTADDDVWYSFVAPGTGAIINVQSVGTYNAAFQVFSSTTNDCNNLATVVCVNSTSTAGLETTTLTTLTPGNTYFVRVYHALGGAANGQFTICVDAGPQCPALTAPADGGTAINLPIILTWNAGQFASGYDVYFDQNNPPTTLVSSNQAGTTYNVNGPLANGLYYWRVQSRNGLGATTSCAVRSLNVAIPSCIQPANVTAAPASATSATVNWLCGTCTGTYIVEYGAPGFTPGTQDLPGVGGTIVTTASLSATLTGLASNTAYQVYVRQECVPFTDYSLNTGPVNFSTAEDLCGQSFYDQGGVGGQYANSLNVVRTFCGTNPGEVVIATFNSFSTESGWDPLYVFNGPSTAYPKFASTNGVPAGNNVYGTGGWWGTQIAAGTAFISSDPSGCLTFAFTSDGSVQGIGWDASIACAAPSACTVPSGVTASAVTSASATISWTCAGCTGPYIVEYGISGFTPGTGATAGVGGTVVNSAGSPANLTGLTAGTVYKAYVRQDCDGLNTTFSNNSYGPATFTTGPGCGSNFYDLGGPSGNYPASISIAQGTTTICPSNPTDKVVVTFSSFQTENGWDALYVFNGPTTADPKIASTNGNPSTSPNLGTGGWWNNIAPTNTGIAGIVLATNPSGCLTFVHISDGLVQQAGWAATVACVQPQYDCTSAQPIGCLDSKTGFTIGGTNTLPPTACAYNGGASTSGVSWWTFSSVADQDVIMSTCGTTTMNTRISVFQAAPDCNNLVCVAGVDDVTGCANNTSEVTFHAQTSTLYYIAVHGNAGNNGIFTLNSICGAPCAPGITNDQCANAASINTQLNDGSQTFTNDDNTCAYVDGPTACGGTTPAVGNWYTFTTGPNAVHRVYVAGNSEVGSYTATTLSYEIYSGACSGLGANTPVSCVNGANGYNDETLAPNTTYRMVVYNEGGVGQEGTYGIWVDHPGMNDAEVTAVNYPSGTVCDLTFQPVIVLTNRGENTLTSALLEVSIDGNPPIANYQWNGSLASGASTTVVLDPVTSPGGAHTMFITALAPNGTTDEIGTNNTSSSPYDATGQTVVVNIKTDNFGAQTSWAIFDAFFIPVATSNPMGNNTEYSTNVCLATTLGNCFSFYLFDSFGDGMCCANGLGSWNLADSQGSLVLGDNGQYTSQSPGNPPASAGYVLGHEFCLPLGPATILSSECNIFNNLLNNKVYCENVGAAQYQFEFSNPDAGFRRRIGVPRNWVKFSEMQTNPLVFGTTYFGRARADMGAAGFSDDFFGAGCDMALAPSQPICTELVSNPGPTFSCGVTKTFGGSDKVWAQPVVGATQYRFNFSNIGEGYNRNIIRPSYVCLLSWVTNPLVNGSTYNVKVECMVNNVWSGYCGAICQVTIQNTPMGGGNQNSILATEESAAGLSVWPNPVRDGQVTLRLGGLNDSDNLVNVDVYDAFGKRVMNETYGVDGNIFNKQIDLTNAASGVYMIHVTANDKTYMERITVQ